MISLNEMQITKDLPNKRFLIKRNFDASQAQVWRAWTESELLDQWWAPKPWRAETRTMDFRPGGSWLYAMVGPDNTRHWAKVNYLAIEPKHRFTVVDTFCDENGNPNDELPNMNWNIQFIPDGNGTTVQIEIKFKEVADLNKIVEMGFEEGFTAALMNLQDLFDAGKV